MQRRPVQLPDIQSRADLQAAPSAHAVGQPPPQSTPVSLAFRTPSVHEGPAQRPDTQRPVTQSEPSVQVRPIAHFLQPSPQSTSPSRPLRRRSLHVG